MSGNGLVIEQEIEKLRLEFAEQDQRLQDLREEWKQRLDTYRGRVREINETDLPRALALSILGEGDKGLKKIRSEKANIEQALLDKESGILDETFKVAQHRLTSHISRERDGLERKRNAYLNKKREVENSNYLGREDKSLWRGLVADFLESAEACGPDAVEEARTLIGQKETEKNGSK